MKMEYAVRAQRINLLKIRRLLHRRLPLQVLHHPAHDRELGQINPKPLRVPRRRQQAQVRERDVVAVREATRVRRADGLVGAQALGHEGLVPVLGAAAQLADAAHDAQVGHGLRVGGDDVGEGADDGASPDVAGEEAGGLWVGLLEVFEGGEGLADAEGDAFMLVWAAAGLGDEEGDRGRGVDGAVLV
ncbi:unnamed protein product [Clonostachys rosea f. rosea IK726]|uniref:Uncharacterized protein n=1 Tax=Clonostachys rosea f. rosea IK726 TaxID=1349383 RepID=A0ACA9URC2_BIOOC|nr:unnamed protein product [Clonostachys rosea f. rosea IK726]